MKRQQHPPFSTAELVKMAARIDDALNKIRKVADGLVEDGKPRDSMLLNQAVQNLLKVRGRLAEWSKAALEKDTEKALKRAREVLSKNRGLKFQQLEFQG